LPQLDREPPDGLVHQPPALLRPGDPRLVPARRRRPPGPRPADRGGGERPARRSDDRRAAGLRAGAARPPGRLHWRARRLRHVVTASAPPDAETAPGGRDWAAGARPGTDIACDPKVLRIGMRLVTKLFNAGKFVLSQVAPDGPVTAERDRAFAHRLAALVERV